MKNRIKQKGSDIYGSKKSVVHLLVIVGGLNWGLVGLFDFNRRYLRGGKYSLGIIYILVGLAALYMIYFTVRTDTYQTHEAAVRHD